MHIIEDAPLVDDEKTVLMNSIKMDKMIALKNQKEVYTFEDCDYHSNECR